MAFSVKELLVGFAELIVTSSNTTTAEFTPIDCVKDSTAPSLIFVDDESQMPTTAPAVMITRKDIADNLHDQAYCVIGVNNVRLAQAKIKQAYQDYDSRDSGWGEMHESAVIHPSAKLGKGVRIGPNAVIGEDVSIGAGTQVRANVVIEHGAQIGANSNIDRGTYLATIIGDGVKLDSLCHIAHNVHIDEGTLFASQGCVAGSTYIGKRVMCSGQVGILDHLSIADNAVLVHRTGVTENITEPGMYAGVPAKPFKEYVRGLGANKRIDRLNLQVKELKQKLLG